MFGAPRTVAQLRKASPQLSEVTDVEIALGGCRTEIELYVGQISGVERVQMLGAPGELSADFHVTRNEQGDWGVIVAGIRNIISNLLGEDYEISFKDFTYIDDDTPPAA